MPQTESNAGLNRSKILDAALVIADRDGLDKLTIRKLSAALDVTPMAVYRHFRDKDAMIDHLLDHVVGRYQVTAHQAAAWRDWICTSFLNMRTALVRHPGILPLLGTTGSSGWNALDVTEEVLGVLVDTGLSPAQAATTFYSLISYTIGSTALECASRLQQRRVCEADDAEWQRRSGALLQMLPKQRYPNTVAAAEQLAMFPSDEQFVSGLQLILDGRMKQLRKGAKAAS